jgi:hypothetical protein
VSHQRRVAHPSFAPHPLRPTFRLTPQQSDSPGHTECRSIPRRSRRRAAHDDWGTLREIVGESIIPCRKWSTGRYRTGTPPTGAVENADFQG